MKAQSFLPQMSLDCPVILETLKRTHLLFNLGSWQVAPSAGDVATLKKKVSFYKTYSMLITGYPFSVIKYFLVSHRALKRF